MALVGITNIATAQMDKGDLESACKNITAKSHSHFNLIHDSHVDKFEMESDFSLEFKENALIIHNGLNEIHVAYLAIKYVSVGKPDKAHSETKGQWFLVF